MLQSFTPFSLPLTGNMHDFQDLYRRFLPPVGIALAAIVFALAPYTLALLRKEEMSRRVLLSHSVLAVWLLLANLLCGLSVYGFSVEKLGQWGGCVAAIIAAGFGGTLGLGVFEVVFNRRLKLGKAVEARLTNILAGRKDDASDN